MLDDQTPLRSRERGERLWSPLVVSGVILQIAGGLVVYSALTDGYSDHDLRVRLVVGGFVGLIGIWTFGAGLMWAGVALALGSTLKKVERPPRQPASPQTDPADLAEDPIPFLPHAGDSPVVATIRRAILLGKPHRSVRRIVTNADSRHQLTDADRALAEGLIAEAARRPIGPLPTDF